MLAGRSPLPGLRVVSREEGGGTGRGSAIEHGGEGRGATVWGNLTCFRNLKRSLADTPATWSRLRRGLKHLELLSYTVEVGVRPCHWICL